MACVLAYLDVYFLHQLYLAAFYNLSEDIFLIIFMSLFEILVNISEDNISLRNFVCILDSRMSKLE